MAKKPVAEKSSASQLGAASLLGLAKVFTSIIETFGWPGGILFLVYSFIVAYGTADQKQRIIEMYVLGKDIAQIWPIALVCAMALLVILAQYRWYAKKLARISGELEEVASAKSALQETLIGRQLQHAETKTTPRRK